ncbi:MAG TPA: hypothetical protein VI011_15550 [Asanoa sp.]
MTGVRTQLTLHRLNRFLIRRNVPYRQRRGILRDLRRNVRDAAESTDEHTALRQLGDIEDMADAYCGAADRRRPRTRTAVIAAMWTLAALVALAVVRIPTFGTIDVFDRYTGATTWHIQLWRLGEMGGDTTSQTLLHATVYSYAYLLFPALAFVVAARPWRLLRNRPSGARSGSRMPSS